MHIPIKAEAEAGKSGRCAGVMLPVSSLPSRHGIGDMGPEAYRLVDLLKASSVTLWQILPMNPLGFGNSPYQPYSSFAGDPLFISLDVLSAQGLLPPLPAYAHTARRIDYDAVRRHKEHWLRRAFAAFTPDADYQAFALRPWVHPYAVFMALKRKNGMRPWTQWPEAEKNWPTVRGLDLSECDEDIRFETFVQYQFMVQWLRLKRYANDHGVRIIGDIPFYVGLDSLDVWADRQNYRLDGAGMPLTVAGVPPDYFSKTGQRWGNPVYDWEALEADGFSFWVNRLRHCCQMFDIIRIDHFRAFDTYWEIPASCPTAVEGEWREAPGYAVLDAVLKALPDIEIIAEDLGMLREEVYVLRDHYRFRGMKIVQFVFKPGKRAMPRNGNDHMVVYTGTHDNQTMQGWYRSLSLARRVLSRCSLLLAGCGVGSAAGGFVRLALKDAADMAVIPAQDLIGLDDAARINTPGTVGSPNWEWKLADFETLEAALTKFGRIILKTGRG